MLDMGIIKLEINIPELREAITSIADGRRKFFEMLTSEIKAATSSAIEHALNAEITVFLGKPSENDNKRNGYECRDYAFKGVGGISFKMPVDRKYRFESGIIPKTGRHGVQYEQTAR